MTFTEELNAIRASLTMWQINLEYPVGHENRIVKLF